MRSIAKSIVGLLAVSVGLMSSSVMLAQDVTPFAEGTYGILLVNRTEEDRSLLNKEMMREFDKQAVLALNTTVLSTDQALAAGDEYNADIVAWLDDEGATTRVLIATSPRAEGNPVSSLGTMVAPENVSLSLTMNVAEQSSTFLHGLLSYRNGDYLTAESMFTTVINDQNRGDDVAAAYLYRGMIRVLNYNLINAETDFAEVLDSGKFAPYVHYYLGAVASQYSDTDKAHEHFATALETAELPLSQAIYGTRANMHYYAGNYDLALADYSSAIELDNTNVEMYLARIVVYNIQGDYTSALKDYDRLLALDPNNISYWQLRGNAFVEMGDYDRAIEDYTTAVVLADKNKSLCQCLIAHRAEIYYKAGNLEMAAADYEKALTYGEMLTAHTRLARIYAQLGRDDEARQEIATAQDLFAGSITNEYITLGLAYQELGDAKSAGEAFWAWVNYSTWEYVDATVTSGTPTTLSMTYSNAYKIPLKLRAGQTLTVSAVAENSAELDTLLVLLDKAEEPVAGNDDRVVGEDNTAAITFKATEAGTYILVVTHAGGGSEGDFVLNVR